jgi:multicomponent Na+:H+ antiporter subunit C
MLYLLAAAGLFAIGFFGLMTADHVLRRILSVNVMGTGVFVVLIAIAARTPGSVPDPVPHAMVLTGIVVAVCGTGLALVLARRIDDLAGNTSDERTTESTP